jgi:hypothetical protein
MAPFKGMADLPPVYTCAAFRTKRTRTFGAGDNGDCNPSSASLFRSSGFLFVSRAALPSASGFYIAADKSRFLMVAVGEPAVSSLAVTQNWKSLLIVINPASICPFLPGSKSYSIRWLGAVVNNRLRFLGRDAIRRPLPGSGSVEGHLRSDR